MLLVIVPAIGLILAGTEFDLPQVATFGASIAVLTAVVSPAVGLATLAFVVPFEPPTIFSPLGLNVLLVGATILGFVVRLPSERPNLRVNAVMFLLTAFVVYVAAQQLPDLTSGYSGPQGRFVGAQFKQLLTGYGACIAAALVMSQRKPHPFLLAGLASASLAAILTIFAPGALVLNASLGTSLVELLGQARATGPFGNANYYGLFQAIAVTAAAGWIALAHSRRARLLLLLACGPLAIALALSYSRGALLALVAGLVSLAFIRSRALGVATAVTAAVLVVIVYPAFADLRLGVTYGSLSNEAYLAAQQSDAERLTATRAGMDLFLSSPIFGVGFGQYHFLSTSIVGNQAATFSHNWYVNVLAEQGAVGAVLWMSILALVAKRLWSQRPNAKYVGIPVLVTCAVGSLFTEPPTSFQTSALPLLVLVAALVGNWTPLTNNPSRPAGESRWSLPVKRRTQPAFRNVSRARSERRLAGKREMENT